MITAFVVYTNAGESSDAGASRIFFTAMVMVDETVVLLPGPDEGSQISLSVPVSSASNTSSTIDNEVLSAVQTFYTQASLPVPTSVVFLPGRPLL